ncbi:hypothetical protein ON010_g8503 [Phytophthora cinnamomi]|nr:hypothetical protein ON010_g8503 [Phytophthora cinnamomi]
MLATLAAALDWPARTWQAKISQAEPSTVPGGPCIGHGASSIVQRGEGTLLLFSGPTGGKPTASEPNAPRRRQPAPSPVTANGLTSPANSRGVWGQEEAPDDRRPPRRVSPYCWIDGRFNLACRLLRWNPQNGGTLRSPSDPEDKLQYAGFAAGALA